MKDTRPSAAPSGGTEKERGDGKSALLRFTACGRRWTIRRPADLESLWAQIDADLFAEDERLPYWVEVWPASLGLAEWLTRRAALIHGRLCLDLGCGLGFTALAASLCGARVLAADYEREALSYARTNAAVNGVTPPLWLAMDWRRPAVAAKSLDVIWGADVLYEKRFAAPVGDFLSHSLAVDGVAWFSDPGRNTFEHFRDQQKGKGWSVRRADRLAVETLFSNKSLVDVDIWEVRRA